MELRKEVAMFAQLMEAKLRQNDYKYGGNSWKNASTASTLEIFPKISSILINIESTRFTVNGAVNMANYMMILADIFGELPENEEEANKIISEMNLEF